MARGINLRSLMDDLSSMYKKAVPVNARTFLSTVFGNREPITERDFSEEELQTLRQTVENAKDTHASNEARLRNQSRRTPTEYAQSPDMEFMQSDRSFTPQAVPYPKYAKGVQDQLRSYESTRDRTSFGYGDYPIKSGEVAAPVGQSWPSAIRQSYTDPGFRMASTLGSAKYRENAGAPFIEDTYGFSSDHPGVYKGITNASSLKDIITRYGGQPGALGEILFSKYLGNVRRPVRINMPQR
jgi:hypothetical protein